MSASNAFVFRETLYFSVFNNSEFGLWTYDGARQARPVRSSESGIYRHFKFNDELYFSVNPRSSTTAPFVQVWDGVQGPQIVFESERSAPRFLGTLDDRLYFGADGDLWQIDGVNPASRITSFPHRASFASAEYDGRIYFRGNGKDGDELWSFDGERDRLEADLFPGSFCENLED